MRTMLAAGVAAIALLAGCGQSDEEQVEDTVRRAMTALADGDGVTACGQMTPAGQEEFGTILGYFVGDRPRERSCGEAVELFAASARSDLRDVEVRAVRVRGDEASATPDGGPELIRLARADDGWKITASFTRGWREVGMPPYPGRE